MKLPEQFHNWIDFVARCNPDKFEITKEHITNVRNEIREIYKRLSIAETQVKAVKKYIKDVSWAHQQIAMELQEVLEQGEEDGWIEYDEI